MARPGPSAVVLLGVAAALAGCLGASGDPPPPAAQQGAEPPEGACALPAAERPEPQRPCVLVLGAGEHAAREASLAAHPTDPGSLVAAWTENTPRAWTVWLATTTDGGTTWALTSSKDLSDGPWHFDPIARFAPNGDALVLFGESRYPDASNILVARSRDAGQTWELARIPHNLGTLGWDAMDLAVAPDTGAWHVVAQSVGAQGSVAQATGFFPPLAPGAWLWTSHDEGATWSAPLPLHALLPDAFTYWPRVAAYEGGVVVVAAKGLGGIHALVSRDAGASFEPGKAVFPGPFDAFVGDAGAEGGDATLLPLAAFEDGAGLVRVTSADRGATWSAPETLTAAAPAGAYVWSVAAQAPDGTLHVLATFGSAEDDPSWGAELVTVAPSGAVAVQPLAGPVGAEPPRGRGAGDEYGGLALGADGRVWWALSDPRGGTPRVVVGWS